MNVTGLRAVAALRSGEYGPVPSQCPLSYEIPKNRDWHIVPEKYRALLALIVEARKALNTPGRGQWAYYDGSVCVEAKHAELTHELFRLVGNPLATVMEYHADWKFSVLTPEDVEREYEAAQIKNGKKDADPPEGGFSDAWRDRPPETDHLFDFYASRANWKMTFSEYWAHERKQRAERKQKGSVA